MCVRKRQADGGLPWNGTVSHAPALLARHASTSPTQSSTTDGTHSPSHPPTPLGVGPGHASCRLASSPQRLALPQLARFLGPQSGSGTLHAPPHSTRKILQTKRQVHCTHPHIQHARYYRPNVRHAPFMVPRVLGNALGPVWQKHCDHPEVNCSQGCCATAVPYRVPYRLLPLQCLIGCLIGCLIDCCHCSALKGDSKQQDTSNCRAEGRHWMRGAQTHKRACARGC